MKIIYQIKDAYIEKDQEKYSELMQKYAEKKYGIDYRMIYHEIKLLINNRKYKEAYPMIKLLESGIPKYAIAEDVCRLYLHCYKPKDAERIYFQNELEISDRILLIDIYLREGRIQEANEIVKEKMHTLLSYYEEEKLKKIKEKILNNIMFGSMIETEYSCFIENGNKLEGGHIVFLKEPPITKYNVTHDHKNVNRPYMIWKIKGDIIYIFPLTTKCSEVSYKLYSQYYPNCPVDRTVKDILHQTTIDNILSVQDKLLESDYKTTLKNIFKVSYLNKNEQTEANIEFLKEYAGTPETYDVIKYINKETSENIYYWVLDKKDEEYQVVEINIEDYSVIDGNVKTYDKNKLIYRVIKLQSNELEKLKTSLSKKINIYAKKM